ncbi:AraC family transcriptional regulator [Mycobacterium spongiae]|uniref:Helix-turn-helix domain-containing protein n=1 Tax=Mycobacterium spongiae TaxID=886343 RepID=A0A975JXX5_9MYCO|nr:AraC family transcriptional regulator [Mycobacterium spongiae]QUR67740.1 helix-turn-helix domain-containing protein [Mycobacterium spongiae]
MTEYTIPIGRAQACIALAARQGWDIGTALEEAGISPVLVTEGRSRVSMEQFAALIRNLWRTTDDELMGLGSAPVPRGTMRLMSYALLGTPDLGSVLQRYVELAKAVPGFPPIVVAVGPKEVRVSTELARIEQADEVIVDALLAAGHRFASWAIGRQLPLRRVEVPYPQPDEIDDYDVVFGAPVVFSAPTAAVVFATEMLASPCIRTEVELDEFLRRAPAGLLLRRDHGSSMVDRVRRILAERGATGQRATADEIAAGLAMSPQTLRRRLRDEHTSIRQIRESILLDAAIASLVRGDETLTALSRRLGFSEPSAFSRAFRRWTGRSPGSYLPRGAAQSGEHSPSDPQRARPRPAGNSCNSEQ